VDNHRKQRSLTGAEDELRGSGKQEIRIRVVWRAGSERLQVKC